MLRTLLVTFVLFAGMMPFAASDAAPEIVDVPDAPGWVAVLIKPENGAQIIVEGRFLVDNLFALLQFDYYPEHHGIQPLPPSGVYATTFGDRIRVVYEGDELVNKTLYERRQDGPDEYYLGISAPAVPFVVLFYAAGDIHAFDVTVHSGHVERVEMGPEAWAMWTSQFDDPSTRIYPSVSIFGTDINSERLPVTLVSPRGILGEFGGGLTFDPSTLETPLGTQTCDCSLKPNNTVAGNYTYTPHRFRGDTLMFWAFAPILPYLSDTETTA